MYQQLMYIFHLFILKLRAHCTHQLLMMMWFKWSYSRQIYQRQLVAQQLCICAYKVISRISQHWWCFMMWVCVVKIIHQY